MGRQPLTVRTIFDRMRTVYGDAEVVDAFATGAGRTPYRALADRVLRLVRVLQDLGVRPGDRVASFANNSSRHVELYYAVPLAGAVLHMINIRLHDDQLAFVVADAGDSVVFVDDELVPRLGEVAGTMPSVRAFVRMGKGSAAGIDGILEGEELIEAAAPATEVPELDEQ